MARGFRCPGCNKVNRLPEGFSGGQVTCSCGRRVKLGGAAPPARTAATSAVPQAESNPLAFGDDDEVAYQPDAAPAEPAAASSVEWDMSTPPAGSAPAASRRSGARMPTGLAVISGLVALVGMVPIGFYFYLHLSSEKERSLLNPIFFFFLLLSAIFVVPAVCAFLRQVWAVRILRRLAALAVVGCAVSVLATLASVTKLEPTELMIRLGVSVTVGAAYIAAWSYLGAPEVESYLKK